MENGLTIDKAAADIKDDLDFIERAYPEEAAAYWRVKAHGLKIMAWQLAMSSELKQDISHH